MENVIELSAVFPVAPKVLFAAWLDGELHGAFTGSLATALPKVGSLFTAWDGYIRGKTLTVEKHSRIVQTWRALDFPKGAKDSTLELTFAAEGEGTRLTLHHSGLPDGMIPGFQAGWRSYYLVPMRKYFAALAKTRASAGATPRGPKAETKTKAKKVVAAGPAKKSKTTGTKVATPARKKLAAGKPVAPKATRSTTQAKKTAPPKAATKPGRKSTVKTAAPRKAAAKKAAPRKPKARTVTPRKAGNGPAPRTRASASRKVSRKPAKSTAKR